MTLKEFVDGIKIESQDSLGTYGHYPFMSYKQDTDGKEQVEVMFTGGQGVKNKYIRFAHNGVNNTSRQYMSLDYPAKEDMSNDFVIVFWEESGYVGREVIPYNNQTGEKLEYNCQSELVKTIFKQFKEIVSSHRDNIVWGNDNKELVESWEREQGA